jgi:hypothetical protein
MGTGMWAAAAKVAPARVKRGDWKDQIHCGMSRIVRPGATVAVEARLKAPDQDFCFIPSRAV